MLIADFKTLVEKIKLGAVCVMPTDTVYGLVAMAANKAAVERIYKIKGRPGNKPFVILISDLSQLPQLSININKKQEVSLGRLWPGPVSVILPCKSDKLAYLHRGKKSLAVRIPDLLWLRELVSLTGPMIATSANKSGAPITEDIDTIIQSLPGADLYIEGPAAIRPSKLALIDNRGEVEWLARS